MKNRAFTVFFLVVLLLTIACEPKAALRADKSIISQAWIDAPLPGSHLPLETVEIVAHATNPEGIKAFEINLNGQQLAINGPDPASLDQTLMYTRYNWQPPAPGRYLIEVKAYDLENRAGDAAQVMIDIDGMIDETIQVPSIDTTAITSTSISDATATSTLTPTAEVTPSITPTAIPCDQATFGGDITVPDGTAFKPGETFKKTWRVQNSGSCVWTPDYGIMFVSGERLDAPGSLPLGYTVNPGEYVDISIQMRAPELAGNYYGYWKLRNPQGQLFSFVTGAALSVEIQVLQPSTATPTHTPTPLLGCTVRTALRGIICMYPCPPRADPGEPCKP